MNQINLVLEDKLLGKGAYGQVIQGVQLNLRKTVAIKVAKKPNFEELQKQAKMLSCLQHPNIVKYIGFQKTKNKQLLAIQLASFGSLYTYLQIYTKVQQFKALKFFYGIVKAVQYIHSKNIVHRDLKPSNILIDKNFKPKLADFGQADFGTSKKRKKLCGTYQYMAPQMLLNNQYDYRIDIWSLGILLYQLVHGERPFKSKNKINIQHEMRGNKIKIDSSLSNDIKLLIQGILVLDPSKRYSIQDILASECLKQYNCKFRVRKRLTNQRRRSTFSQIINIQKKQQKLKTFII